MHRKSQHICSSISVCVLQVKLPRPPHLECSRSSSTLHSIYWHSAKKTLHFIMQCLLQVPKLLYRRQQKVAKASSKVHKKILYGISHLDFGRLLKLPPPPLHLTLSIQDFRIDFCFILFIWTYRDDPVVDPRCLVSCDGDHLAE